VAVGKANFIFPSTANGYAFKNNAMRYYSSVCPSQPECSKSAQLPTIDMPAIIASNCKSGRLPQYYNIKR
jgi:hypothetical protein